MRKRNEIDERQRGGSPPGWSEDLEEPAAAQGRESLAWIRALANAWEDERHQDAPEEPAGGRTAPTSEPSTR
jgi:hypothetical protein